MKWFWLLVKAVKWIVGGIFALLVSIHEAKEIWHYVRDDGISDFAKRVGTRLVGMNDLAWAYVISLVLFVALMVVVLIERPRKKMKEEFEQDVKERLGDIDE